MSKHYNKSINILKLINYEDHNNDLNIFFKKLLFI